MEKYGIALGGGGSRGSYQLGVWRYLINHNIAYDCVVGTSIGSINGAFMAQGDYGKARDAWFSMGLHSLLKISEEEVAALRHQLPFTKGIAMDIPALAQAAIEQGGLSLEPLREKLQETISEEKVRASGIDLGIVTVNLTTRKPVVAYLEDIPEGQLHDYILASCSLPIFKPARIGNDAYIDGAFHDNVPVKPLAIRGYQKIIAADLSGFAPLKSVGDVNVPVIHIKNSEDLGPILNFNQSSVRANMRLGYLDAAKAFGDCLGKTYYIRSSPSSHLLRTFSSEELSLLLDALNRIPMLRWDGRWALRNLRKVLKKNRDPAAEQNFGQAESLILAALEISADQLDIDRLRFYSADQLIQAILTRYETILRTHPLSSSSEIMTALKERLAAKTPEKPDLQNMLPEIVERFNEKDRSLLFHFLAHSLPRYCITILFIFIIRQRIEALDFREPTENG